jgi:hypothetical protein
MIYQARTPNASKFSREKRGEKPEATGLQDNRECLTRLAASDDANPCQPSTLREEQGSEGENTNRPIGRLRNRDCHIIEKCRLMGGGV